MKQGFLQALGVAIYCTLVGFFMWNAGHIFGPMNSFLGPVIIVMLFSASALVCTLLVFYRPYKLFFEGKKKEAVNIVITTTGFLFVFLLVIFGSLLLFR